MAVWLGGETQARGVVRTMRRDSGDVSALAVFVAVGAVVVWAGGSSIRSVLVGVGVAAVGAVVCVPWELISPLTGGVSLRRMVAIRLGYVWRRLHHLTAFTQDDRAGVPAGVGSLTTTDEDVDGMVVAVTEPSRAADRGRGRYMVTVLESQGDTARIRAIGQAWTAWLDYLGGDGCLVTHLSTVTSVTDWDPTDHIVHVQEDLVRVAEPDRALVSSYAQVVDEVTARAAHQRTWVALRFPVTRRLEGVSDDEGENVDDALVSDEDAVRQGVAEQTAAAVERAGELGLVMRPLDGRHLAALCRHLMDPDVSPDDVRGLGSGPQDVWEGAFPAWVTSRDRRSLEVDGALGRRWMTTWEVPAWSVAPGWLPEDWLYPVVTALPGGLHRSFTTQVELEPARQARARARADVTSDSAAVAGQAGQVTDGSAEAQATASQIRLSDLQPGSSTVGVSWSMAVAFHARSARQRRQYERQMAGALADSYVNLERPDRLRSMQDMALGLVLPFTRAQRTPLLERWLA